jgi:multiple sugar transport system permease protein
MASVSKPLSKQPARKRGAAKLAHGLRQNALPYLFLFPLVAILIAFLAIPFVSLIYYSLQRTELGVGNVFVGLQNFNILLRESRFAENLTATLIYLGGVLLLSVPMAYFAAILISTNRKGVGPIRTIFLIPWVLAPVVTALLFRTMLDPQSGPITIAMSWLLGHPFYLTLTEEGSRMLIILHSAWRSFPLMMLLLAAGITSIPQELYEAARVDGAGLWQQFRRITLPLTRVPLFSAVLLISVYTIQDAEGVYALTQGGPGYGTEVTGVRLFKEAFLYFNIGFASSIGIALITLSILIMIIYFRILGQGEKA